MTDRERLFRDICREYEWADEKIGLPNIHIECKDSYNLDIHKEIKNSMNNAKCNELPIVVSKRNHEGWLVTMELDDWLELYISWLDFIGWAR